jgi:beta-ureidopropionase / N-carbamoyl-L-amino-acid hydrolase
VGNDGPGTSTRPAICLERLKRRLESVNRFGADGPGEGIHRLSFSEADMRARRWLIAEMERLGLVARMDTVGNVVGRWNSGDGPAVMLGSHLDSVPRGGRLDGALGVMAALECVETAMEQGIAPGAPIEVVATSEEEGRFGGMLGAQAMAGTVDPDWFAAAKDDTGLPLAEAMRAAGLEPQAYPEARRDPSGVKAFLELHIEQGPVLDRRKAQIGVVEGITGLFKWEIRMIGTPNHAGTTPMDMRNDAFSGLVEFAAAIPRLLD